MSIKVNGIKVAGLGASGKSAYQAAQDGGYTGTEREFNTLLASAAPAPKSATVTLSASGWSDNTQTVTVQGVLADEAAQLIQPMPAIASQSAYYAAGILCTGQAANSLTFSCTTAPTESLKVYVVMQEVSA